MRRVKLEKEQKPTLHHGVWLEPPFTSQSSLLPCKSRRRLFLTEAYHELEKGHGRSGKGRGKVWGAGTGWGWDRGGVGRFACSPRSRRGEKVSGAFLVSGSYQWGDFFFLNRQMEDCVRRWALFRWIVRCKDVGGGQSWHRMDGFQVFLFFARLINSELGVSSQRPGDTLYRHLGCETGRQLFTED